MPFTLITFGGTVPLIIYLVIPIASLSATSTTTGHLKLGTIQKFSQKFGLFLIASDSVNLLGQTLPTLFALKIGAGVLSIYMAIGFAAVSVIHTPILTIMSLKPVHAETCVYK
jgi:hypothetical protein